MKPYRLSLDIGTNSIGWCALALETQKKQNKPRSILDMGVRIFPDGRNPKDGSSNAVARRIARGMRRNRDRFLERRNRLMGAMLEAGLMPKEKEKRRSLTALDPYELRARGIDEGLRLHEFGRAIFHLNQRRGFKSNRKRDANDKDTGAIKDALREQRRKMDSLDARTFGEYLYRRRKQGESVRSRLKSKRITDAKGKEKEQEYYDFYPSRGELEHEFDLLWRVQAEHHPAVLTQLLRDRIHHIIFYQRPLKAPVVGKCTFERSEDRAPKVLPIVQRCRIYQELNHLQILDTETLRGRPLCIEERDILAALLCEPSGRKSGKSELKFDKMHKKLGLGARAVFSLESEKRKGIEADTTSALLAHKGRFGARWYQLSDEEQESILDSLLHENDEETLIQELARDWELDREHAEGVANTPLPDGYARLGLTATRKIVAELVEEVIPYSEAVVRAGYESHSQFSTGEARERLPYYGEVLERHVVPDPEQAGHPAAKLEQRYGKVTNPTVHIALNQVRKVVNEVIKIHGRPAEIHVEVLRELKNSLKRRKEVQAEQARNQERNDKCAAMLREEFHLRVNRENIQRLRLWQELGAADRLCVYSGKSITPKNLFTEAVEVDHILPWRRTLDDSMANKILCMREANREKTDRTPFEAWGDTDGWPEILARSTVLPRNKRWRFAEDAMGRYEKEHDFIARQLTDSQYIAKLAREYLAVLFDPNEPHKVVCLPGRLTGLFRHHMGLNEILDEINPAREASGKPRGEKNRDDHRNHAVDALIVGLMDRAFLQRAAATNARLEKAGVNRLLDGLDEPWAEFHAEAREALSKLVVSHKLDHGIEAALHNQTAYGFAKRPDSRGGAIHRISVVDMKLTSIPNIKGKRLRADLVAHLSGRSQREAFEILEAFDNRSGKDKSLLDNLCNPQAKGVKDVVARAQAYLQARGIRRVRVIEPIALIPIKNRQGNVYKGFKPDGNAYLDIYLVEDGERWEHKLVTCFEANARKLRGDQQPNAKRRHIARLFNRDMLELEHKGERRIFYIQKMSDKQIALAEHFEANTDGRTRDANDPFRFVYKGSAEALRKAKVRFLVVNPAGRIRYLSDAPDD